MSDFLTRLAERELGAGPIILPRRPSVYSASPVYREATEGSARDDAQLHSSVPPRAVSRPEATLLPLRDTIASSRPGVAASVASPPNEEVPADPTVRDPVPARVAGGSAAASVVRVTGSSAADTMTEDFPARTAAPPVPADRGPRQPQRHALAEGGSSADAPATGTTTAQALLVPKLGSLPASRADQRQAWREVPQTTRVDAATGPIVRVTIGRVEVRAVTPGPLPAKKLPAAPGLSLGDYLRQRNRDRP